MTQFDQATTNAFTQDGFPGGPAAAPRRQSSLHGPHTAGVSRTPLTEAIAARMRQAASAPHANVSEASFQLRSFEWPAAVETLAARHRDDYLGLAPAVALTGNLAIGVAGVHQGSGATTTVLSIARCLAAGHGPVTIVDADPLGPSLANTLGVLRVPTLGEAITNRAGVGAAIVQATADRTSLVVMGSDPMGRTGEPEAMALAAAAIRRRSPITLIDFGSVLDQPLFRVAESGVRQTLRNFQPSGVLLVRSENDLNSSASAAQAVLESTGAPVLGLIENAITQPTV